MNASYTTSAPGIALGALVGSAFGPVGAFARRDIRKPVWSWREPILRSFDGGPTRRSATAGAGGQRRRRNKRQFHLRS